MVEIFLTKLTLESADIRVIANIRFDGTIIPDIIFEQKINNARDCDVLINTNLSNIVSFNVRVAIPQHIFEFKGIDPRSFTILITDNNVDINTNCTVGEPIEMDNCTSISIGKFKVIEI